MFNGSTVASAGSGDEMFEAGSTANANSRRELCIRICATF